MKKYVFTISGLKIRLHIEHMIFIAESFEPFVLKNTEKADVDVFLEAKSDLKPMKGQCVYEEFFFKIYEKESKYNTGFYDREKNEKLYASALVVSDSEIRVSYLKEYADKFANSRSCFMHFAFEELLMRHKRMMLHSSFIQTKYGGLLFSGPSRIGKSTQADLWKKYRNAEIINGDRTILKETEGVWMGFGSPYAGSSRYFVNKSSRIAVIIFLEKGICNKIKKVSSADAFRKLYSQMMVNIWDRTYIENLSVEIEKLSECTPVYEFSCTPDRDAVDYLDKFLDKEFRCE